MSKKPSYILAGRLERLFANLIDTLILLVPHALLISLFGETGGVLVAGFLINLGYFTWFTASTWQASPGQRVLNMYVVHLDRTPLDLRDAFERFLAYTMPVLPMYATFIDPEIAPALTVWLTGIWFGPILLRESRMGIHDQLCRTQVVAGKASLV